MGDDADVDQFVLEDRTLLDVQLEEGVDRPAADRLLAVEADARSSSPSVLPSASTRE